MTEYTDPTLVTEIEAQPQAPLYGQPVRGYGGKVPTRYRVRYINRWHRVYMMQYGNAGSAYIVKGGEDLILDTATEYRIEAAR